MFSTTASGLPIIPTISGIPTRSGLPMPSGVDTSIRGLYDQPRYVPNPDDNFWQAWQTQMQAISDPREVVKGSFWIIVGLPSNKFSELLEWHETIPMLVPVSGAGEIKGVATSREEMDRLVAADYCNVHLTYKVKLKGHKSWRKLLEFLAENGMLERETN